MIVEIDRRQDQIRVGSRGHEQPVRLDEASHNS